MTDFKVISPAEIVALGEFLDRESLFKRSMGIAMLDGFLTAIVIGPETVMPSEYLPWVWDRKRGKSDVTFKDQEEATRILGYMQGMQNRVAVPLMGEAPTVTPVFLFEPAWDHVEWLEGFLAGVQFDGKVWDYAREAAPEIFEPFDAIIKMERDDERWDDTCREFGASLVAIRDYFRAGDWRRAFEEVQVPFVRQGPKVGRNDPCPCGSGRKFKKCCGMTGGAVH